MNENAERVRRLIDLMNAADRAVILARRERDAFPMGSDAYNRAADRAIFALYEFYDKVVNSSEFSILSRNSEA